MKKVYTALFVSMLALGLSSCTAQNKMPKCVATFKMYLEKIDTSQIVDFGKLQCFSWDSVMIIAPAFGRGRIEEISGIELPSDINYDWAFDGEGSKWWLVFVKNKKAVTHFSLLRTILDFSTFKRMKGIGEDFFFLSPNTRLITYSKENFLNSNIRFMEVKYLEK